MLKKLLFLYFFFSISLLYGQEKPHYTQYIFNNYLLNPALSGIENYADIKVGRRVQWSGIKNGPRTSFLSANWSLGKDYLWSNALSLPGVDDNPMSRSYMQYYTSSPAHHGMGLVLMSDKTGAVSRLDAGLSYAYHLQLNSAYNLSVGVYAGISRLGLDLSAVSLEDANDPALAKVVEAQFKPDIALGLWYYGARFFAGAAMQQVLPQHFSFSATSVATGSTSKPILFLTSGYRFYLDEDLSITPSLMARKGFATPFFFDTNVKFSYKDKLWLGASYRKSDAFSAMLGFNLKNFVNFTYAYDLTVSELKAISGGTHELVLGFQLGAK